MAFTFSGVTILGTILSGIISFFIALIAYPHCVGYTMRLPEPSIPTKRGLTGSAIPLLLCISVNTFFLFSIRLLTFTSITLLVIITIVLTVFFTRLTKRYIQDKYPDNAIRSSGKRGTLTKAQYSMIQMAVLMLFLPTLVYTGTGNLILYLLPDTTIVTQTPSGYAYSISYGWPKGETAQMTKSYLHNHTHETLYITNVLYAIPGKHDYNDFSVTQPYPPESFTQLSRRPEYVMTGIPLIRQHVSTKAGPQRRFASYLVDNDMLDKFKNARMNIYNLYPNHETSLGIPSRAYITDSEKIFKYQDEINRKLKISRNDLNPGTPYIDHLPSFPGGEEAIKKYIASNIRYPKFAKMTGSEGTVAVDFTVTADGRTVDISIARSVDPTLDNEAMRIIEEMPRWNPGILNSHPAPCRMTLPVQFILPADETE